MKYLLIIFLSLNFFKILYSNDLANGWIHNGNIISPDCFPVGDYSGDNWEEFAKKFSIDISDDDKYMNFFDNPGEYFGNKIDNFDGIPSPWAKEDWCEGCDETLYIVRNIDTCSSENKNITKKNGRIIFAEESNVESVTSIINYILIEKVSNEVCQKLAPNFEGNCIESYLSVITHFTQSHSYPQTYIYGKFKYEDKNLLIPLKHWLYYSPEKGKKFLKEFISK